MFDSDQPVGELTRLGAELERCVVFPRAPMRWPVDQEELDLVVDCVTWTLGPRTDSPDRPLLRL